ncbi:folylpolyglutamate synthase/dihydrofolate synthase family protein [Actinomadura macrotermitis]|uniref:Uncharacterized protein n=1 Tax=Actinomadura macrotermitis TaxID=2585200 RepID=A0A7K0BYF6_9ACTN|nr:hypothetical protein [Actinomadura macrotermitis]
MSGDEVFFREWEARGPGDRRSVQRARALAGRLDVLDPGRPVLTVVGSKGKGTAATYASATLAAAGLRVCTVTSPGLRNARDRIRVDGRAVTPGELAGLAGRLADAMDALPAPAGGYLSPAGLFTLAGLLHARQAGAGVLVLEAGMGGRSDEVSLFPPAVAAVTPVFREHIGVLGDTVGEIAAEKAGVVAPATRAVLSAPQTGEVAGVLAETVRGIAGLPVETAPPGGVPADLLPAGLARAAAELGHAAALRLLEVCRIPVPPAARVRQVLGTLTLPGRLSWHSTADAEVLADAAIDRAGIAAALAAARARWGGIDHVLVCLPDHKDVDGAITELAGLPVTFVRLPQAHLRFTRPLPADWRTVDAADLTLDGLGRRVVALGTVYFIGLVLELADADTERLFSP